MIDERHQELASLYAFDLLEGAERVEFETLLRTQPEVQALVDDLRATAAQLAHAAPGPRPPEAVKERLLTSLASRGAVPSRDNVQPFPRRSTFAIAAPWLLAAGFALCAAWLGERYYVTQAQAGRLADQRQLADLALKSAQAQLEAERLVSTRVAASYNALQASSDQQLAAAKQAQAATARQLAEVRQAQSTLADQLAAAQKAENSTRAELIALNQKLEHEGDLARLKIATLASMLNNSPQALAVAVWDPTQQEGVFTVDKLPATTTEQRYELWVIDGKPVSAGVFTVGADGRAKVSFKPTAPIKAAAKFAVSREKNDGRHAHATPGEVIMISE